MILVSYDLDSAGVVSNPIVDLDAVSFDPKKTDMSQIENLKKEIINELEKIFRNMPQWLPARIGGKNVPAKLVSPILLPVW